MATKRRRCEEETVEEVEKKRPAARMKKNRLSNLPVDLQLRILSFLESKHAVQTIMLSKTWVSLWTSIPVLEFNAIANFHNLFFFDKFVSRVLCVRDRSAKLDRLTFVRRGLSSAKILTTVFDYAFSHGVKELEACVEGSRNHRWPDCLSSSFTSLKSLNLQSQISIHCPFLGPRSGSFKKLTDLNLRSAIITDLEPFSGFPVLERVTLVACDIYTHGKPLNLHALNLSDLSISCSHGFNRCVLTTPKLRSFHYDGSNFPLFRSTHAGLPVLETIVIGYNGVNRFRMHDKRIFDDLVSMFCALPKATSLTLWSSVVHILCLFREDLVNQSSPFRKLKCLKVDLFDLRCGDCFACPPKWSIESFEIPQDVKAYLLPNCPNAKHTLIYPNRR